MAINLRVLDHAEMPAGGALRFLSLKHTSNTHLQAEIWNCSIVFASFLKASTFISLFLRFMFFMNFMNLSWYERTMCKIRICETASFEAFNQILSIFWESVVGNDQWWNIQNIRELGLRRILKARLEKLSTLHEFKIPKLNFDAGEYLDLIDWQDSAVTELPLTVNVSEADIWQFVATHGDSTVEFNRYLCHTQSVERCVKLVTEESLSLCGQPARDGFIRSRLEARSIMPVFNTKSNYRVSQ